MKLQYQGATSDADRSEYVEVVVQNVLQSMQAILCVLLGGRPKHSDKLAREALPDLQIRIDGDTAVLATLVSSAPPFISASEFRSELARPIWTLWKSRPIKEALARRNAFQLNDSADYFFQAVPRIAKPDYLPTEDDVLRSRVKTTGVIEHEIRIRDRLFKVTDVGGQRSERKKWLNVFESVSVLLFLASLAEYDQRLREDEAVSRLEESLTLFETIANSSWFASSTISEL
jgi:guanine nucleotide-binding protein G(i) subunit alpha